MPRHTSRIDIVLQRCAWSAQILLFFAAIAGYILTVRPVYQKQLLDEQIAERTVLLREATSNLEKLRSIEAKLKVDNERLSKEADITYVQLRRNLLAELSSTSFSCTWSTDPQDGGKLFNCVTRYVDQNVTPFLRPEDQQKLYSVLKSFNDEIVGLPQQVDKALSDRLKKAKRDNVRFQANIEKNEREFFAEVSRLRSNDKEQLPNFKQVKDLGELRGPTEVNLYLSFLRTHFDLVESKRQAGIDELNASSDVRFDQQKALSAVLKKMSEKLK